MKKKYLAFFLAAAMTLSLCACGKTTAPSPDAGTATTQTTDTASETSDDETSDAETSDDKPSDNTTEDTADNTTEDTTEKDNTEETSETATQSTGLPEGIVKVQVPRSTVIPENEALAFVKDMKVGWNLGNTFDANNCDWLTDPLEYESAWCGVKTTKELILALKDAGFNTIRVPVSWHNHVDADNNIDEAWLNRVQEVVDWIYDEDMYVILNIHHDDDQKFMFPSYECLDTSKDYLTDIWTQLATRFADYDTHLIFETMNEPRQKGTDIEWWINDTSSDVAKEAFDCINQMNQTAVDAIRSVNSGYNTERYIMTPGYCASPEFELINEFQLPDDSLATADNRIILSVHAYTPYNFALNQSGTSTFDASSESSTADIDSFMRRLYMKYVVAGTPVVIGEFGALDKNGNTNARTQYAAYYMALAKSYGMTAVWWDNNALNTDGECFQIIDRETLTWSFPEIRDQLIYYSEEH